MNDFTTYSLFAVVAAVAVIGTGSAFALDPPCPTCEGDPMEMAQAELLKAVPLLFSLDQETYATGDTVTVSGHVAHVSPGYPVTLIVRNSLGNIVTVDQLTVDENGDFETMLDTTSWSMQGIYQVMLHYRENNSAKTQFLLEGYTGMTSAAATCGESELAIADGCAEYLVKGGMVTGAMVSPETSSIILDVAATDDGMLIIDFPEGVIDGIFMVLVDDEESDDVTVEGNTVTVWFLAGTEKIEILGSHVIPEFGTIAALVLAVAIVSIVAVSARSRLSIIPRF